MNGLTNHPPARRLRQRGAAVILALLTLALVAGIAASTLGDLGVAMDHVSGQHDQIQARQFARGAIDWARNVLADDARNSTVDHLGEAWATRIPPTPVEEGEVAGDLKDQSGLFNLNNLYQNGGSDALAMEQFQTLLELLGVNGSDALRLTNALLDWLDSDSSPRPKGGAEADYYASLGSTIRPANAPLIAVAELRQVRGFSTDLVARLTPFVTAIPTGTQINVNTAPAEVLAAAIPGLGLDGARSVIQERQRAWYKDINDFSARLPKKNLSPDTSRLATTSRYFLATGRARFGVSVVRMEVLLDRKQTWPEILWHKQL